MERTRREEAFRKQYEEQERYNLTNPSPTTNRDGIIFFCPTRGMVTSGFDAERQHYGTDIAATPGESVVATLDGVVVMSSYTAETGYVVVLQHSREFVSVYKHCSSLLCKAGAHVKAGEVIALTGNSGELTTGPHLHFELWQGGRAVNPEHYVVF